MKAGKYAEACPKLAESQRLDPGIGTQFHLADCYEREGKVASAWAAFFEVASLATASGQADREKAATARARRLEPRLPRLSIAVPAASQTSGLEVTRDGIAVGSSQWDSPMPVDPGEHEVKASAPGRRPYVAMVALKEGTTATVTIPALEALPEQSAGPTAPVSAAGAPTASAAAPAKPAQDQGATAPGASSGPGPLVIGMGVLGVVGLGAGTVFGLMARSKFDDSKSHCNPADENLCNAEGVELRDDAFTLANVSTAGFIVGGAAIVGAGVLWLTSGSSQPARGQNLPALRAGVQATPSRGALVVRGSF